MVVAEFKNYSDEPGQAEVESIQQYLLPKAMRSLGLLCARKGPKDSALKARRRAWAEFDKLIVFLSDLELEEMLIMKSAGEDPAQLIDGKIDEFLLSFCA
jgi:hypothetical protein